jgi:hypothetical protein
LSLLPRGSWPISIHDVILSVQWATAKALEPRCCEWLCIPYRENSPRKRCGDLST